MDDQPCQNQAVQNCKQSCDIIEELDFQKYKKKFLPIFLKGYEKYLRNTKQYSSELSLYQKVDNEFNNLKVEGNVRVKYGIKLIQKLLKNKHINFIKTINDYRRTFAPLYFRKKIPKKDFKRVGKQINLDQLRANLTSYMQYLQEPFPPKQLETHLKNKTKNFKTIQTNVNQIQKQIQKPSKERNAYRDLVREVKKLINYKGGKNIFQETHKGLYDFFKYHKQYFIADKKELILQAKIKEYLNKAQNKSQRNKIQKYLDYVNKEIIQ